MEHTINAHTNTNFGAHIFDMDIRSAEFVGLVDQEVENLLWRNSTKSLGDFGNRFGIAFVGDLNVVVNNFLWRVITQHEYFVGGLRNQEEINTLAFVVIFFAHAFDELGWRLASHHKLEAIFAGFGFVQRNNKVAVHLLLIKQAGN